MLNVFFNTRFVCFTENDTEMRKESGMSFVELCNSLNCQKFVYLIQYVSLQLQHIRNRMTCDDTLPCMYHYPFNVTS